MLARGLYTSALYKHVLIASCRKAADLAILKSISQDATDEERKMVEVFSEEDDFVCDFDFTPIHVAALNMYPSGDHERPTLSQ